MNTTYDDLTCIHSRIDAYDVRAYEEVPIAGFVKHFTENRHMLVGALISWS